MHRHHPPLVYGRNMVDVEPEASTGWALCKTESGITGQPCYALVTYEMPNISVRLAWLFLLEGCISEGWLRHGRLRC